MMERFRRRGVLAALTAVLVLGSAGCFPTRGGLLSDLKRTRMDSYARWRTQADKDELLPRMEGQLSIQDAIKFGLAHNPRVRSVLEEQAKSKGQLLTAYGEALPSVELTAGYTRLDEIMTIDLGVSSFSIGDRDNWTYQLSVTQPLFKGGSIPAAIRGAKLFQFLSDEKVRQVVQDAILAVALAYEDVLLGQHLYEVQVEALKFAKANLRDVIAKEQAGMAIPFDRLRARVEVSNVEADMIQQRNLLNRAWTAMFRAMGVSQKSEVTLSDELVHVPMEPEFEAAVRLAFLNRPELYQGEIDIRLQETALRILYSDYLPELEAWGWHMWAKPDPHEASNIQWDTQWMAGVRLTWNLFDGLRREGNIIQQRAAVRQSLINLADAEQSVLEQVKNAILDLADAGELIRSQQLNLERGHEALRLVTIGAREGVNTELEVLDARAALTRARGLYYTALHAHVVARLTLQRAIGMLGTRPGADRVPEEGPVPGVIEAFMEPAEPGAPGPAAEPDLEG